MGPERRGMLPQSRGGRRLCDGHDAIVGVSAATVTRRFAEMRAQIVLSFGCSVFSVLADPSQHSILNTHVYRLEGRGSCRDVWPFGVRVRQPCAAWRR